MKFLSINFVSKIYVFYYMKIVEIILCYLYYNELLKYELGNF